MGCQFQKPSDLNTTTHSSTPRRSLGPQPRHRKFLRLRLQPARYREAGEMLFPYRFRRLLRQWLKLKRPKPSGPLYGGLSLKAGIKGNTEASLPRRKGVRRPRLHWSLKTE